MSEPQIEKQASELLEKIRKQFDFGPYPRVPVEKSPKDDFNALFIHNLVTPYYLRNKRVTHSEGKLILDAGCGTGYKALALAEANPGAKIVGVDLSPESVKLARERLRHHGFEDVEFHALAIEDLPALGLKFDYINCDEVLYLTEDPAKALHSMKLVLKPEGIIRSNLHSYLQRFAFYRAQEVFKLVGLMEENPEDEEMEAAVEMMKALKNGIDLKRRAWNPKYESGEDRKGTLLSNHMLQGDKGYTIPQLFEALRAADLEFVSMVNWRHWELTDLFNDPDNLPVFLAMGLEAASIEEKLHLFELLHPVHRLLDFWCAHPNPANSSIPIEEWGDADWQNAVVHLHPQLKSEKVKQDLMESIRKQIPFEISRYITLPTQAAIRVESNMAACLLPLWEQPQSVSAIVERWLKIKPLNPVNLEPMSKQAAFEDVKTILERLEVFLYLLIEHSA